MIDSAPRHHRRPEAAAPADPTDTQFGARWLDAACATRHAPADTRELAVALVARLRARQAHAGHIRTAHLVYRPMHEGQPVGDWIAAPTATEELAVHA